MYFILVTLHVNRVEEVKLLGRVQLFATPWAIIYQAPLSWDFAGKNAGGVAISSGIFPTRIEPGLLLQRALYHLSH